jgi:predicted GIY-YIG superfamily endonuclease
LENGGFYVGCTRNLAKRLMEHFEKGGAMAIRESRPVAVEKTYQFEDCLFGNGLCS